jgi:hypothetical protein
MTAPSAHQLIARYTHDLPEDLLNEIVAFIQFVRYKRLKEGGESGIAADLQLLRQQEWAHLEQEFSDLDAKYPRQDE